MKSKTLPLLFLLTFITQSAYTNPPFVEQTCWCTWEHLMLQRMSLEEKIGQVFMIAAVADPQASGQTFLDRSVYTMDQPYVEQMIQQYHVGGVIFFGVITPEKQIKVEQRFQQISKTPLLIGQDLERGSMYLKNGLHFPRAMTLGALAPTDEHLIYELGKEIGRECHALGVHINFAPVADINNNPHNPIINDRSFGENKINVARKSTLFMHGLQQAGILACAKHWPGHGDTDVDSHFTLPRINHTKQRLEDIEFYPFKKLIDAGVSAIMCAHLEIPALEPQAKLPASLSKTIVTDVLHNQLQFNGLTVTDALGMRGITQSFKPGELELRALLAGNDLLVAPVNVPAAVAAIKQALTNGILTEDELDTHILNILKAKKWAFHRRRAHKETYTLSAHTQKLQEKIYRGAITLVKNEENILPLTPSDEIISVITIGDSVDNTFCQTLNNNLSISTHEMQQQPTKKEMQDILTALDQTKTVIICVHGSNKLTMIEKQSLHTEAQDTNSLTYFINALRKQNKALNGLKAVVSREILHSPTQPSGLAKALPDTVTQNALRRGSPAIHPVSKLPGILARENKKIIVVAFENPYNLALYQSTDAIITAYENVESAQKVAALTIIGKHNPRGLLPITACAAFHVGLGLRY